MTIHTIVAVDAGTGMGFGGRPQDALGNGSIEGMWPSRVSSSTADSRRTLPGNLRDAGLRWIETPGKVPALGLSPERHQPDRSAH